LIGEEWEALQEMGGIKAKTAKNNQGMGRSLGTTGPGGGADGAAAKKAKISTSSAATSGSPGSLTQYLSGIDDRLKLRVKTVLQLKITDMAKPTRSVHVVLSGATCMKKVNQICAFVTGHDSNFAYHSQKGTCLKGSRIELTLDTNTNKVHWVAEKSAQKKAAAAGAGFVTDKTVKIVQVFQGLNLGPRSGLAFDSRESHKVITTPGSVVWVSPDEQRYAITVQTIAPYKSCECGNLPMPRIVMYNTEATKTGFGKGVNPSNTLMCGGRQGPSFCVGLFTTKAAAQQMTKTVTRKPVCDEDGSFRSAFRRDDMMWDLENVAISGPPGART
jgi:hypothetical protein